MTTKEEVYRKVAQFNLDIEKASKNAANTPLNHIDNCTGIIIIRFKGEKEAYSAILGNVNFEAAIIRLIRHYIQAVLTDKTEVEKHAT